MEMEKADLENNIDIYENDENDGTAADAVEAEVESKVKEKEDESEEMNTNCEVLNRYRSTNTNSLTLASKTRVFELKEEISDSESTVVSTNNDLLSSMNHNESSDSTTTTSSSELAVSGDIVIDYNGVGSEKKVHQHNDNSHHHVCEIKTEVTDTHFSNGSVGSFEFEWDWDNNIVNSHCSEPVQETDIDQSKTGKLQDYRSSKLLVEYSDSESDSDLEKLSPESEIETLASELGESSYEDDSDGEDNDGIDEDTDNFDMKEKRKKCQPKGKDGQRLRTTGEVFPEELPPLDYLTISVGEHILLEPLGTITGIVDILVVIQAVDASPALFDDTVLFLENRQPLGLIFETMGTLDRPFYTVRFNSNDDIVNRHINIGDKVMYAPKASNLTKYVFIAKLKKKKFVDASWECDNEPPPEELDYSDDDEEVKARRKVVMALKKLERNGANIEEENTKKKRRSLKTKNNAGENSGVAVSSNRSGLPQGSLNRNPFSSDSSKKPGNLQHSSTRNTSTKYAFATSSNSNNSNSTMSTAYRPPQPQVTFGGKPSWQAKPWSAGPGPSNINSSNQFSFAPPTFQSSLPPVYNTTIPAQFNFGFGGGVNSFGGIGGGGIGTGSGPTPTSVPQTTSLPPTGPLTHAPSPLVMPPVFNTNQPPPPFPFMFTSQFNQSQPPPQTTVPPPVSGLPPPPFPQQTYPAFPPPISHSVPVPPSGPFSFNFPPPSLTQNK